MNFLQASEYIDELNNKRGSVLGLDNMQMLLEELGNPQDGLKFVHIAGTNGKGSVCTYISQMLINSGYRVGIYTSPVVFEYLEKIRVGRRNISKADFAQIITEIEKVTTDKGINITAFEVETAAAFLYFAKKECDIVVLETGLGGLEDATNVVNTTLLSVITSISLDHVGILGKTIDKIAAVKCGIIKPDSLVVSAMQDNLVKDVIIEYSKKNNAKLTFCNESDSDKYKIGMKGAYQRINASVALNAIKGLISLGYQISPKAIEDALKNAVIPGRFEIISKKPLIIIDGAHNVSAAICLRQTLIENYKGRKMLFIMGMFSDKDYEGVIEQTADLAEQIITVPTSVKSRSLSSYELAKAVAKINPNVSAADSVEEAMEMAKLLNKEMIVAFGSLSYLGRLKEIVKDKKNGR